MKILRFISNNILFFITLFLLAFIPLYPKLPLVDVKNTWAYIRLEDFVVLITMVVWFILFLRNKISLKTPLTLPIMLFWIIGGISTLHGVMILFPTLSNVFSNVALLSYLRRIEYMFLFFVAFSGMKDKKFLQYVPILLSIVLFLVALYGFGQKFLGFPAFLTGNEEFAKGIPLRISALGRVPSTFAGHYDLAAYLVLVIPILVSMVFGLRNIFLKIFFLISISSGLVLMFLTVSRISFFVLLFSLSMLLIVQKKKLAIISLFVLIFIFLIVSPSLLSRFGSTVSEVDVLVNTKTGKTIGHVKEVTADYFKDKTVLMQPVSNEDKISSDSSAIFPFEKIPPQAELIIEANNPNGESLPQGSSYINLSLSPVIKTTHLYFIEKGNDENSIKSVENRVMFGDFVIKKAKAYDISFTTRFQGEWPNTILAFQRNVFLGSGYGSVSLAVDNNYLRILGESGLIGFFSFILIFLVSIVCIKKIFPKVDSQSTRSFILGFIAGSFGLALNAVFIDVFEASKIAFIYWLLMGIVLGSLYLYKDIDLDFYKEIKKILFSSYAMIVYFVTAIVVLFSGIINYYFVGDDFTWLAWAADCNNCNPIQTITQYFTQANGFFYRPGTKLYFYLMQNLFWLNQAMYHLTSIFLHLTVVILIFIISKKILKNFFLSAITAFLFLVLSGYSETVFWISTIGFLFNAVFALLSLLFFILWKENGRIIYFIFSFISIIFSLLFHEMGIIIPLLIILYDIIYEEKYILKNLFNKVYYYVILLPVFPYLLLRLMAKSHWLSGDYSYNFIKLPFNIFGNIIGYFFLILFGPFSLIFYEKLRITLRGNVNISILGLIVLIIILISLYRYVFKRMEIGERRTLIFGILFFIISLIPFLGLGNISSRYSYLSSFGMSLVFVFILKKIYDFVVMRDKYFAIATLTLITILFLSIQLFQFQKIQTDWKNAGEKSKSFLASLEHAYAHYGISSTSNLYFVNVPIRNGEAWVFPVGLNDAVSLLFSSKDIKVHQVSSVDQAFADMVVSDGRVFEFNENGSLVEWIKNTKGEIISLE